MYEEFLAKDQWRVMNIYGQGGIGKTYLLHVLEQRSLNNGDIFIRMDSLDFTHTPHDFVAHMNLIIGSYIEPIKDANPTIYELKAKLASLVLSSRVIIAIDNYDKMAEIDRWFRQFFLMHIDPAVKVVITGRHQLRGEWAESPIWAAQMTSTPLRFFKKEEIAQFLKQKNIEEESTIISLSDFTEGHPLALALATLSVKEEVGSDEYSSENNIQHVLLALTKRWLEEVTEEDILELIEAAAMVKQFNQHSLSVVIGRDVSYKRFIELTNLSFVQKLQNHWSFHELVQDAIKVDLLQRSPDKYNRLKNKVVSYYKKRLIQTRNPDDIAMFFYHIGDELIQSVFFHSKPTTNRKFYMEVVDDYNFDDVIRFFEKKKYDVGVSKAQFYNRVSNQTFRFFASFEHNKKELEFIGPDYIKKMGLDSTKLLRDYSGKIHAMSVVVPVHKGTIDALSNEPVSRAYFKQLSKTDWQQLNCPKEKTKAYFIRLLDYVDATDKDTRIAVMYDLLPLLLTGAKIIVSSPLPFFQALVKSFGFTEISAAQHDDYGKDSISRTYELDLAPDRLAEYMSSLSEDLTESNQYKIVSDYLQLTEREAEILKLIIEGHTNNTIAKQLFVAEITVKKHISRIFAKAEVKNRAQLVKKVMEQFQ
ncbi:LuxR C-terminal-related transcriptional regulator [Salipaludibacillus daqingensis]|uniref:LuxR C-terminal-related transcriptional regulator n=1 Tax=Salipaludibacillus daqingensis TaxID=3041001 RepID=UPI0024744EAF|nr:LuxR C-terminal-related transcriptional regulator [Salipaludibacillus daqingensis]